MTRARGYTTDEIAEIMGAPIPKDPKQRRAYALFALTVLAAHDKERFMAAWLLGADAPDELIEEWAAISHEETRRRNPGRATKPPTPTEG